MQLQSMRSFITYMCRVSTCSVPHGVLAGSTIVRQGRNRSVAALEKRQQPAQSSHKVLYEAIGLIHGVPFCLFLLAMHGVSAE
jgi:hypothetical protein